MHHLDSLYTVKRQIRELVLLGGHGDGLGVGIYCWSRLGAGNLRPQKIKPQTCRKQQAIRSGRSSYETSRAVPVFQSQAGPYSLLRDQQSRLKVELRRT